ncbi:MAG: GNAT family N-acetyltransferase [Planctomycetes bacterium]|nr:GNAT family N-acetyltransferase [Planctomycetota bacterium]MCB9869926.1 GNAT family N-acetyltransferase [Planctomycetota bacterium]
MSPLEWSFARGREAVAALGPEWRELELEHGDDQQMFQTHAFTEAFTRSATPEANARLRVLVGREAGRTVLVWPLIRRRRGPFVVLEQVGGLLAPYDDVLVCRDGAERERVSAALDFLATRSGVASIHLRGLREHAVAAGPLASRFGAPVGATLAPFVPTERFADGDAYLASLDKWTRKDLRRSIRLLESIGPLRHVVREAGAEVPLLLDQLFHWKAQWLRARGLDGRAVMSDAGRRHVTEFARLAGCGGEPRTRVSALYAGDRLVAVGLGFEYRGRHYEYLDAFDAELHRCGAGRVRLLEGIRDAIERRVRVYDLMTPATEFKELWTAEGQRVFAHALGEGVLGRVFANTYLRVARPWLKKAYNAVVVPMRRRMVRVATHSGW